MYDIQGTTWETNTYQAEKINVLLNGENLYHVVK